MGTFIQGLHHITAMAGAPQSNLNFYTGILGLRLVKKTVNFDAPDVYHLYYGNETGAAGTIMTFFPFPGLTRGRIGSGQATKTAFSIPSASLGFWQARLKAFGVETVVKEWKNSTELQFSDPDGLPLSLVANDTDTRVGVAVGSVPLAHSIRGFYGVTLSVARPEGTLAILTQSMEHQIFEEEQGRFLLGTEQNPGALIEVIADPSLPAGRGGSGTVHHIAFATATDETQLGIQQKLMKDGYRPTEVLDRQYFHSIYFREPGGVLFEVATLPPGFLYDEPVEHLGESLKLPSWVESKRPEFERGLA
ncbi:MAG: ring-cleaving dioxygenase, partial [Bacteroidia bacterium]|nr:ring-cleaving dioxygenase [Bacteroidia bacterium]